MVMEFTAQPKEYWQQFVEMYRRQVLDGYNHYGGLAMVKITSDFEGKRNILLDQVAPILAGLKEILSGFEEPEAGYFGPKSKSIYVRLLTRGLTLEQQTIEKLLDVARKNGAVLSIDTRHGPLVATIMKHDGTF